MNETRERIAGCCCAFNLDGSTTTMLCPQHAEDDPCYTKALVSGRRRRGSSIVKGRCTHCGWSGSNDCPPQGIDRRPLAQKKAESPIRTIVADALDDFYGEDDWPTALLDRIVEEVMDVIA